MTPFAWTIQAWLAPAALGLSVLVKWWTIWFVLGQNFSRTSAMSLSAILLSHSCAWLLLVSGAIGSADPKLAPEGLHSLSWIAAWAAAYFAGLAIECAWLRLCMRVTVRPDWSWRRYDRLGYAVAHFLVLASSVLYGLWREGAFRVS